MYKLEITKNKVIKTGMPLQSKFLSLFWLQIMS
jgi:hypothetical protein